MKDFRSLGAVRTPFAFVVATATITAEAYLTAVFRSMAAGLLAGAVETATEVFAAAAASASTAAS